MKARRIILTLGAAAALAVPAAQPAGAAIPGEADAAVRHSGTSLHKVKANTSSRLNTKSSSAAIRLAAYPR
jgi:predicted nicotinamide N-methyase